VKRRRAALIVAPLLVLAACGSTPAGPVGGGNGDSSLPSASASPTAAPAGGNGGCPDNIGAKPSAGAAGAVLAQYTVTIPDGSDIALQAGAAPPPQPECPAGVYDLGYDGQGKLSSDTAPPDSGIFSAATSKITPSVCQNGGTPSSYVMDVSASGSGDVCFLGHGVIAGLHLHALDTAGDSVILDVTVWAA
jgi:hypothetical protein